MIRFMFFWIIAVFVVASCAQAPEPKASGESVAIDFQNKKYPEIWWAPIKGAKKSWEISPASVRPPQVILSKRNSLGLLSNFAATPFVLDGIRFGSLEGFWQSTKFPESKKDPRWSMAKWPHTRKQVEAMVGFEAKKAGDFASKIMKRNNINWVSFKGKQMKYREQAKGDFYHLIYRATQAKISQNKKVRDVLSKTSGLSLLPDHSQGKNPPPAWQYYTIYMDLRDNK